MEPQEPQEQQEQQEQQEPQEQQDSNRKREYCIQRNYQYDTTPSTDPNVTKPTDNMTIDEWKQYIIENWTIEKLKAKRIAYIFHDKDVEKDGLQKVIHVHGIVYFENAITPRNVMLLTGCSSVKNCQETEDTAQAHRYLTHTSDRSYNDTTKFKYDVTSITFLTDNNADYQYNKRVKESKEDKAKSAQERVVSMYLNDILQNAATLNEIRQRYVEDAHGVHLNLSKWYRHKQQYITANQERIKDIPYPKARINMLISGKGGVGKDTMAKAIANLLYPNFRECDRYFEVGADGVEFQAYNGQPVIIWSDARVGNLIKQFGGISELFKMFDTQPTTQDFNIKYGNVSLKNAINIFTSQENYKQFLNGLSGEYTDFHGQKRVAEDKNQAYRRFAFYIHLNDDYFQFGRNKGVQNDDMTLLQQYETFHVKGNIGKIRQQLKDSPKAIEIERQLLATPLAEISNLFKKLTTVDLQNIDDFSDYGTVY